MQVGLPNWYKMVYYQQQEGTVLLFQIQKVKDIDKNTNIVQTLLK